MFKTRSVILNAILTAMLMVCLGVVTNEAAASVPRILVLNSYDSEYDWSNDEMLGLRSGLSQAFPRSELSVEYLDTKKFPNKQHFSLEADLLKAKYGDAHFDVIIAMDNAALEFAARYRKRLFSKTPLVFCGINDYEPFMIGGLSPVTGVAEYQDSAGTLALALQLHPETSEVTVIHDYTDTGIAMRRELEEAASRFTKVKLHFMDEMPLDKAVDQLKRLTAGHLVLLLSYTVEKGGRTFTQAEAAELVSSASPVPVYAVHAAQLGSGVVGGRMMDGRIQGQRAAELAVRILKGDAAESLRVITGNLSQAMFDYRVLNKFRIDPAKLPADAVIINKPPPTYAVSKTVFWYGTFFTTFTTFGLIVLCLNIRKRKRLENSLRIRINEYHETLNTLRATDEMLRAQVDEYVKTHEKLIATEELLRVQLEAVAANEQKFRAVFDNSPITAALTNVSDGTLYEVNQSFLDTFGFSRDEVFGKSTIELGIWVHETDRDRCLQILKKKGFVRNFEVEMRRKGGEKLRVLYYGVILEVSGKPFMLSGVMDISVQRQLEDQVRQQQKLESIGLLAGGIAHDFNNMLTPIFVYAEMIRKKFSDDDPVHKRAAAILEASGKAKNLVKQLLSFSRNQALSAQIHNLNEIIRDFSEILQRTIRESVVINHVPCPAPCLISADRTQIEQILLNLTLNAQDAINGNGTIIITTGQVMLDDEYCQMHPGARSGQHIMLSVSDSGCGMDETTMSHIFEPFFSTKAAGKGTGLGLATVYGIVKQHNGHIDVQSKPGRGTTFRIYLPETATSAAAETIPPVQNGTTSSFGQATILLVEDNEMVMDMTRELLENSKCTVLSAYRPEDALGLVRQHQGRIDLLLSDVVMPQMSGPDLHGRLKEFISELPVLYMSGYSGNANVQDCTLPGEAICIVKPFTAETLLAGVAKALAQAGHKGTTPQ